MVIQSTYPEELWGVDVTSKDVGEVTVAYGFMLRVSHVSIESHNKKGKVGVKAVIEDKEIPLCSVDECGAHLEFIIPGGYSAKFILSGGHTAKTKITLTGTLSYEGAFASQNPENEGQEDNQEQDQEDIVEDVPLTKRRKQEPATKTTGADSDATIELDSLPRLPSSWAHMTAAQKEEAIRRIRAGHQFKKEDTSSLEDESFDSDDLLAGDGYEEFEEDDEFSDVSS
eukprot:TRINITY_DN16528_c0_g1_i2.p1 TRINITY_DN16528_c0_g1~~TRINITY_DN16528_c0_g1_i2.p1  ORF type:complete len:227 (+),score=51.10 TRINITY_DN16528_c0_g1_i2:48-728(+)